MWSPASPGCSTTRRLGNRSSSLFIPSSVHELEGDLGENRGRVHSMSDTLKTWVYSQEACVHRERACGGIDGVRYGTEVLQNYRPDWSLTGS